MIARAWFSPVFLILFAASMVTSAPAQLLPASPPATAAGPTTTTSPRQKELAEWLARRSAEQAEAAKNANVFHGFRFTDEVAASGIRFEHRAVEDANKYYKAIHYDHSTGLAAADVDNDGAPDLYFVNQIGGNELWRNLGNGKFENITEKAGVALKDRVSVGAAFGDIDNDGDPDLFVTSVRVGNALFENLGQGRFRNITEQAGVGFAGHSSGPLFFDYDNDGRLDLFVSNVGRYTTDERGAGGYFVGMKDGFKGHLHSDRTEESLLYRNLGAGKFQNVTEAAGARFGGWSGDAAFTDLNEDGYADLYVLNMQGDDRYFENQRGTGFVDRTSAHFPKTPWGAMGIKFFDFNQDGRADLFLTDMHSDMTGMQTKASKTDVRLEFEKRKSEAMCTVEWTDAYLQGGSNNIFGNALYLNEGQGRFREISDQAGAETLWPWGVSVGDVNADGFEDAFITAGMGFGFRYCINSMLLNEQGRRFFDSEFLVGIEPRRGGRTEKTAFTLDCAGDDRDHPYCKGQKKLLPVAEILSSRSSVLVDLDNDGDLDLVTNEMNDRPQVLVSDLTAKKNVQFLKIKLVGTRSNRDGLGALVKVHAGGRAWHQRHDGKSGYLAQSSLPLYFGLGDAASVERVEVTWPSGRRQTVDSNLKQNSTLVITEP